ncbi:NACHT domain-containing protein [Chloroflexi bacterium TSY]|nr:NACHT domain-containing protein [Chloroflexi bacterium TSY]
MHCPKCETSNVPSDALFCHKCGKKLQGSPCAQPGGNIDRDQVNVGSVADGSLAVGDGASINNYIVNPLLPDTMPQQWTEQDTDRYKVHLHQLHATTRILGKSEPISLENIYTDVYILDELTAHRRFDIETLKKRFPPRSDHLYGQERYNGLEVVKQSGNLFILGKPGAGKTTFLRYIVLQAAKGNLNKFPIFITLKEWSQTLYTALYYMILKQFDGYGFPHVEPFLDGILRKGEAIVLFDGLDEVNQEGNQRSELTQQLNQFSEQYPNTQCLITCRIAASDYQFPHFQEVEVADFTDDQVKTYVDKWFIDNEEKRGAFFREFEKSENRGLKELASVPLLLSLLCLVFDKTMNFPKRRAELYKEALDALLKEWDSSHNIQRDTIYRGLSVELKQRMFADIAAESFEQGNYFLSQEFLKERIEIHLKRRPLADKIGEIDGVQLLKAIEVQHGIFVERAKGIYSFSHLTLQEYFTAKYIVDNEARGTLERLITQEHLVDDRWHVVFLLTASLLYDARRFFTQFQDVINALIADDDSLLALVRWADRIAAKVNVSYNLSAITAFYLYLNFVLDFALAFSHTRTLSHAHALSRTLSRTLDFALDLDINHTLSRALDLNLDLDLDRALDINMELALDFRLVVALTTAKFLGLVSREKELVFAYQKYAAYINQIAELSQKVNAQALMTDLNELAVPDASSSGEEWRVFTERLRTIMLQHRDIGYERQWREEQNDRLDKYLQFNKLFFECLEVSDVSNREEIENRILMPPE